MTCVKRTQKFYTDDVPLGVTKTKTLENQDLGPNTRLSFQDYEN